MSGLFLRTGARDRTGRRASVAPRGRPHPCAAAAPVVQSCHVDSSFVEGDVDVAFVLGLAGFLGSLSAYAERHRELFEKRLRGSFGRSDEVRSFRSLQSLGTLVLLLVLFFPSLAFAADGNGVVWGPQSLGSGVGGGNGVVVLASNRFSAAAVALGYNPNDHQTFTDEVKTKLSNESSGGAFYSFVQLFQAAFPDGSSSASSPANYPEWGADGGMEGLFITWGQIYGYSRVFWGQYTSAQRASAIEDLQTVLRGGSLGGGSGSVYTFNVKTQVITGSTVTYALQFANGSTVYYSGVRAYNNSSAADRQKLPVNWTLSLDASYIVDYCENNNIDIDNYDKHIVYIATINNSFTCNIRLVPKNGTFVYNSGYTWGDVSYRWYNTYNFTSGRYYYFSVASSSYSFDGSNLTVSNPTIEYGGTNTSTSLAMNNGSAGVLGSVSGGGNLTNNWPQEQLTGHPMDEPAVPTPPVYDPITYTNPGDDPIPTPTPITYTVGENPTNTSPNDYTPWLEAILNELKAIHRDMVGLGNSMRSEFRSVLNTFWSNLKAQLRAGFQAVLNGLDQNAQEVMDYMQDLAEWLVDQFDFTFTAPGYDDSSLISWIKKIWARQGTGDINSRPVDPSSNPSGQWVWTTGVTQGLLSGLNDTASGVVTTVSSAVAGLTGKFPLSVPWDIYRVMQEFSGSAVTPYVDLSLPTGISGGTYHLVIDLSPYDSMMAVVRQVELVAFGAFLAWSTKDLLAAVNMSGIVS